MSTEPKTDFIAQARALDEVDPHYTEERAFNRVLGQRIAWSRASLGWEQDKLAQMLGVSQSAMSRIERGSIAISVYKLNRLAHILPHFMTFVFSNKLYKVPKR